MTKSYKMPVLLAFYNNGNVKTQIDEDDIYRGHKEFYYTANNWKDLGKIRVQVTSVHGIRNAVPEKP